MFHPEGPSFWELAHQALSSTVKGYDLLAPKFDVTPFRTPTPIVEATFDAAGRPRSVLDLCCGTGAGLEEAAARDIRELTGVDFSQGMLAEAQRKLPKARLLQDDVLGVRLDERFDLVTCFGAFGHILPEQEPALVATVRHHLAPDGCFAFATATPPPWYQPAALVARGFNAAMRVRNALVRPAFIMYYLTFTLPGCLERLREGGLEPEVVDPGMGSLRIVVARRR